MTITIAEQEQRYRESKHAEYVINHGVNVCENCKHYKMNPNNMCNYHKQAHSPDFACSMFDIRTNK
jgi:ribosomal protein L32